MGQAKIRQIYRERGTPMGVLVTTNNKRIVETMWECVCKAEEFGLVLEGRQQDKLADRMTDKLLDATGPHNQMFGVVVDGKKIHIGVETAFNLWKLPTYRSLKTVRELGEDETATDAEPRLPLDVFFETEEFDMLMKHVTKIRPSQNRRKDWLTTVEFLEDCKSKYSGSEVEVRNKLKGELSDG